jgi:pimeloyl-ACP methyl ester carboxylesterase
MTQLRSADRTSIAFETMGQGPAVILVDGALCSRNFGPMRGLAALLAARFTVYLYDRRGRGESGDTQPFAVEREVEDHAALIERAGGAAYVYGISSGAALVLHAASALGPAVRKLAMYEPPYDDNPATRQVAMDYTRQLTAALADGRRGDAVALFMGLVGAPPEQVAGMRQSPIWPAFEAVAPTLAYDEAVLGGRVVPLVKAASIAIPALIMNGDAGEPFMRDTAAALARVMPRAEHRILAGQRHDVAAEALAPVLREFFQAGEAP